MFSIHNTLTNKIEIFTPIDPRYIFMYVCGPTVYDDIHVGNARPIIFFDVLARYIRYYYGDTSLNYVMNMTDVDDKIINKMKDRNFHDFIGEQKKNFLDVHSKLSLSYVNLVSVVDNIDNITTFIDSMIIRGHAYESGNHIFFDSSAAEQYNHGILSNRKNLIDSAETRIGFNEHKRSQNDFVLWKPTVDGIFWKGPKGIHGRPGWHIECSVLSKVYLSDRIDIHGGGTDLIFPHHENERIQSCCLSHTNTPVKYWVHNGTVLYGGKKMAKSLENVVLLKDVLNQYGASVVKYHLLKGHYRRPMDWAGQSIDVSAKILENFQKSVIGVDINGPPVEIVTALAANMNTPLAFTHMSQFYKNKEYEKLASSLHFLGLG